MKFSEFKYLFSGLLFVSLFSFEAIAETRLAYSKKDKVEIFVSSKSKDWCNDKVQLKFVGRDAEYYNSDEFNTLFQKLKIVVSSDCEKIKSLNIKSYTTKKSKVIYSAIANKSKDWKLEAKIIEMQSEKPKLTKSVKGSEFITNGDLMGESIQEIIPDNAKYNKELAKNFAKKVIGVKEIDDNFFNYRWIFTNSKKVPSYIFINTDEIYKLYSIVNEIKKITIPDNIDLNLGIYKGKVSLLLSKLEAQGNMGGDLKMNLYHINNNKLSKIKVDANDNENVDSGGYGPFYSRVVEQNNKIYIVAIYGEAYELKENSSGTIVKAIKSKGETPAVTLNCDGKPSLVFLDKIIKLKNPNDSGETVVNNLEIEAEQPFDLNSFKFRDATPNLLKHKIYNGYDLNIFSKTGKVKLELTPEDADCVMSLVLNINIVDKKSLVKVKIDEKIVKTETKSKVKVKVKVEPKIEHKVEKIVTKTIDKTINIKQKENVKQVKSLGTEVVKKANKIQEIKSVKKEVQKAVEIPKTELSFNGFKPEFKQLNELFDKDNSYVLKTKDSKCSLFFPAISSPEEVEFLYLEPKKGVQCISGYLEGQGKVAIKYTDGRDKKIIKAYFTQGNSFSDKSLAQLSYLPYTGSKNNLDYISGLLNISKELKAVGFIRVKWSESSNYLEAINSTDILLADKKSLLDSEKIKNLTNLVSGKYAKIAPKESYLQTRIWASYITQNEDGKDMKFSKEKDNYLYFVELRKQDNAWSQVDVENHYMKLVIKEKKLKKEQQQELDKKQKEQQQKQAIKQKELEQIKELKKKELDRVANIKANKNNIDEVSLGFTIDKRPAVSQFIGDLIKTPKNGNEMYKLSTKDKACSMYFPTFNDSEKIEFLYLEPSEDIICENGFLTGKGIVKMKYVDGRDFYKMKGYFAYGAIWRHENYSKLDFIGYDYKGKVPELIYKMGSINGDPVLGTIIWDAYSFWWHTKETHAEIILKDEKIVMDVDKINDYAVKAAQMTEKVYNDSYSNIYFNNAYETIHNGKRIHLLYDKNNDMSSAFQKMHKKKGVWEKYGNGSNYYMDRIIRNKKNAKQKIIAEKEEKQLYESFKQNHLVKLKEYLKSNNPYIVASNYLAGGKLFYKAPQQYSSWGNISFSSSMRKYNYEIKPLYAYEKSGKMMNLDGYSSNQITQLVKLKSKGDGFAITWPHSATIMNPTKEIQGKIKENAWFVISATFQGYDYDNRMKEGIPKVKINVNYQQTYHCKKEKCVELLNAQELVNLKFEPIPDTKNSKKEVK